MSARPVGLEICQGEPHSRHGATPDVGASVLSNRPKLFENKAGKTGTHMMIGPDDKARFWTIILVGLGGGRFRPITGWPSSGQEIRRYKGEA